MDDGSIPFINGVAIGLCSMVNRGCIGLAGASGSGIQEVMVLVHRNGFGVSHAIGTGGRDMSDEVGGISMIQSIKALEADEDTKVIALISKPPAQSALLKVMEVIKQCTKPVVVHFLNGDNKTLADNGIIYSETFDETAKKVMELACGHEVEIKKIFDNDIDVDAEVKKFAPSQKYYRAILCGGSLADETQILWRKNMGDLYSNVAFDKNLILPDPFTRTVEKYIINGFLPSGSVSRVRSLRALCASMAFISGSSSTSSQSVICTFGP